MICFKLPYNLTTTAKLAFQTDCRKRFSTIQDLVDHLKAGCPAVTSNTSTGSVQMNCPFGCINSKFSNAPVFNEYASVSVLKKLQHHMKRNCKGAKTFDALFFSNTDIQKGKGIYHCEACGESFRRKQNLEGHRKSCIKSSQQHDDPLAYENSWFAKLDLFVQYVKVIGHGDIKKSYINGNPEYKKKFEVLLLWSNTNKKRKSELSANKLSLLNQNSFVWELSYSHESNESRVQAIRDLYV
jgi:hypothetical protein